MVDVVLLDEELDRLEEPPDVEEEGDQRTDRELMMEVHVAADGEDHDLADDAE